MVPYFCLLLVIFGQWIMLFPHGQISFNKPINKSQKKVCHNLKHMIPYENWISYKNWK